MHVRTFPRSHVHTGIDVNMSVTLLPSMLGAEGVFSILARKETPKNKTLLYATTLVRTHDQVDSSSHYARFAIFAAVCISRRNEQRGRVGRMMHKLIEQVSTGKHEAW